METSAHSLVDRPDLTPSVRRIGGEVWEEYLGQSRAIRAFWPRLYDDFSAYQLALCNPEGVVVAVAHAIPFRWDGSLDDLPAGVDDVLARGFREQREGVSANTLSALAIAVGLEHRRQGHSQRAVLALRDVAAKAGSPVSSPPSAQPGRSATRSRPLRSTSIGRAGTDRRTIPGCERTGV